MNVRPLDPQELDHWDEWLRAVPGSNARQTSFYRRGLELYGHQPEILVAEEAGAFAAGALLGAKQPGPIGGPLIHASGGIALQDPGKPEHLRAILDGIFARAREQHATSVEVSLRIPRSLGGIENPDAPRLEEVLRSFELEPSVPFDTYYVDLMKESDEALLESLGKNPRRHIRKAQRDGLIVERATGPEDFAAFEATHKEMCSRKGLSPFPAGLASEVLLPLVRAAHAELFVARFRGIARNFLFAGSTGQPVYLWGALDEAARDSECPQTGQATHYAAMCYFRALGRSFYDFGGTPGPIPDAAHPNFSVWKFKHEFGVTYVPFLGFWKSSLRPASAAMLDFARKAVALGRKVSGRS